MCQSFFNSLVKVPRTVVQKQLLIERIIVSLWNLSSNLTDNLRKDIF